MEKSKSLNCSPKEAEFAEQFLDTVIGNAKEFICDEYNPAENDSCDKYFDTPDTTPSKNYKFYLYPLLFALLQK